MTAPPPVWARRHGDVWRLTIRVQPAAARTAVTGCHGDALKVRVASPANEGKANAELVRFLAAELGVARGTVEIRLGASSRTKVVEVPAAADPSMLLP